MTKKQKSVKDMTTEEIAKMIFPPTVRKQLKQIANVAKPASSRKKSSK